MEGEISEIDEFCLGGEAPRAEGGRKKDLAGDRRRILLKKNDFVVGVRWRGEGLTEGEILAGEVDGGICLDDATSGDAEVCGCVNGDGAPEFEVSAEGNGIGGD